MGMRLWVVLLTVGIRLDVLVPTVGMRLGVVLPAMYIRWFPRGTLGPPGIVGALGIPGGSRGSQKDLGRGAIG